MLERIEVCLIASACLLATANVGVGGSIWLENITVIVGCMAMIGWCFLMYAEFRVCREQNAKKHAN
jgi:arginine exporter protein ArgO